MLELLALLTIVGAVMSDRDDDGPVRWIRWGDLPRNFQADGFIAHALLEQHQQGGHAWIDPSQLLPDADDRVRVFAMPMDDAWRMLRHSYPGEDDPRGHPVDLDAEGHWDDRGPAAVLELAAWLRMLGVAETDKGSDLLDVWLQRRAPRYSPPPTTGPWEGHSSEAAPIIGELQVDEIVLPPIVVSDDAFIDGRHRVFAARIADASWVPAIHLHDLTRPARRR